MGKGGKIMAKKVMDYKSWGLASLRSYAKVIGVRSPSSLRRNELIENIQLVLNGSIEPRFTNTGRPRKETERTIEAQNEIINVLKEINDKKISAYVDELAEKLEICAQNAYVEMKCVIQKFISNVDKELKKQPR